MTGCVESYTILACMLVESRSFVILDGVLDLYGLKCDGLTALVVAIALVLLVGEDYEMGFVLNYV